jgi:hypothetical protein
MLIRLPHWLTIVIDWLNEPLYGAHLRRIDPLLLAIGVVVTAYYWTTGGWYLALEGAALYAFIIVCVLWVMP